MEVLFLSRDSLIPAEKTKLAPYCKVICIYISPLLNIAMYALC